MKQKHLQFFLEITLPDENTVESDVLQIDNPADVLEWLNQLKLRFPGLQATLSPLQKKAEPMSRVADSSSKNGRPSTSSTKQLKRLPVIDTVPEQGGFEQLTERQKDIVNLLFKGYSYDEIGKSLSISLPTVRAHLHSVYKRLRVKSRAQVVAKIFRQNLRESSSKRPG